MQSRAVSNLHETSLAARDLALELLEASMLPQTLERVSPLCLDALYGAMATLHWLYKEGGDEGVKSELGDVGRCISRLGERWKLAEEYLALVHFHDLNSLLAIRGVEVG